MSKEIIKPIAKVIGQDSNVFITLGICKKALIKAGLRDQATEMQTRVLSAGSYDIALCIMMEYVEME